MKKIFTKKRNIALAGLVVIVAGFLGWKLLFTQEAEALAYTEFEVTRGDITVSLSGSGAIAPSAQYEVVSMVGGDVLSDTFEEGDRVEKGQLLYTFDASEMQNSLERANLSLEKSRMNYEKTVDSYAGLAVTSPISGKIAEVYVQEGDSINTGARVVRIVDDSYLTARIPFSEGDAAQLREGQSVKITVENTFETLDGTITKLYDSNRVVDGYITVVDAEISVRNPGLLSAGTYVSADADGLTGYEAGELKGGAEKIVTAQAGGMIEKLHVLAGENVGAGALIVSLSSDTADDTLREGYLSLREAELSYENTERQLSDYNLTAPISGSVISKSIKAGDSLEASTKTVMAVIADMSELSFTINVDELDIAKVKAGQNAIVTVDALAGQAFSGVVDNVGILGTSSNGVTTYPVKVRLEQTEGLWPGMNATATIVVDSVSDVLMIPITAVSRGSLALVKGAVAAEGVDQGEAPDGAAYARIETGLNNESFIEVRNGLSEGDVVLVTATQAGELQQNMMMGPGFGTTTVRVGTPGAGGAGGRPPGAGQGGSGGGAGPGSGDGGGG